MIKTPLLLAGLLLGVAQAQVQTLGLWPHSVFNELTDDLKVRYVLPPMDN